MTAKEKAQELFRKMSFSISETTQNSFNVDKPTIKKCSLISIDETIKEFLNLDKLMDDTDMTIIVSVNYLEEVKEEITKL